MKGISNFEKKDIEPVWWVYKGNQTAELGLNYSVQALLGHHIQ